MSKNEEDNELWPPIHLRGETVSHANVAGLDLHEYKIFQNTPLPSEQRTAIKWFPGVNMYKALSMAARSGMEDVIRLLVAAGNDIKFLERNVSLCKLMSKMSIS